MTVELTSFYWEGDYILDIWERFNMRECNLVGTPLVKGGIDSDDAFIDSLQYAAIATVENARVVSYVCVCIARSRRRD